MSTVAFIPARGGSKGIPGKNIKEIAGKPLIAWSIEQAKKSKKIDKVVVSTDSNEIASCAREWGAEVPFLRPDSLSDDTASTESAMLHFCQWMENEKLIFTNIILIQPTSPVRGEGRFDEAIEYFEKHGLDSLVSVSSSHRFYWQDFNSPKASYDYMNRPRRQDIPESEKKYIETGSFYITRLNAFRQFKNRLCGDIGMYLTPEEESYEIDTFVDFKICEEILINYKGL